MDAFTPDTSSPQAQLTKKLHGIEIHAGAVSAAADTFDGVLAASASELQDKLCVVQRKADAVTETAKAQSEELTTAVSVLKDELHQVKSQSVAVALAAREKNEELSANVSQLTDKLEAAQAESVNVRRCLEKAGVGLTSQNRELEYTHVYTSSDLPLRAKDIVGKTLDEVVATDDEREPASDAPPVKSIGLRELQHLQEQARDTDVTHTQTFTSAVPVANLDRGVRTVQAWSVPLHDAEGNLTGVGTVTVDAVARAEQKDASSSSSPSGREDMLLKLQAANLKLQRETRSKSAFVAQMSHELRTPLNGLLGTIDLLLADEDLSLTQREGLNTIRTCGKHLLHVINNILDFSKIEAGALTLDDVVFNPIETVREVLSFVAPQAASKNLTVTLCITDSPPDGVRGDPGRLRQLLLNLVGNAIKFTESQGRITVEVKATSLAPDRTTLQLSVRDTGIGIEPEKMSRLFRPFSQLDQDSMRRSQGTGLGLAISKQLVEMMGGDLHATSVKGEGSTFYFSIPFIVCREKTARATDAPESDVAAVTRQLKKLQKEMTVLVVDDNDINVKVVTRMLQKLGWSADSASDGGTAVQMFKRDMTKYRVVLMDCEMPIMDGYQATREIREHEKYKRCLEPAYVIALTADVVTGAKEKCMQSGMDAYVPKPVSVAELEAAMTAFVVQRKNDTGS